MNYNDIKNHVIDRTNTLSNVPYTLLDTILSDHSIALVNDIRHYYLPLLEVVTHAEMWFDDRRSQCVRSILMNGEPAIVFIGTGKELRNCSYYVINRKALDNLLEYILIASRVCPLAPALGDVEPIPELAEDYGFDFLYGAIYHMVDDEWRKSNN
jgi:hypothetical protein